jgi:hypothetical protein
MANLFVDLGDSQTDRQRPFDLKNKNMPLAKKKENSGNLLADLSGICRLPVNLK